MSPEEDRTEAGLPQHGLEIGLLYGVAGKA